MSQSIASELIDLNIVNKKAPKNKISTGKYRWWNVIFLFLFEQMTRVVNAVNLVVAILNTHP